jgi:hypothetical protein
MSNAWGPNMALQMTTFPRSYGRGLAPALASDQPKTTLKFRKRHAADTTNVSGLGLSAASAVRQ